MRELISLWPTERSEEKYLQRGIRANSKPIEELSVPEELKERNFQFPERNFQVAGNNDQEKALQEPLYNTI